MLPVCNFTQVCVQASSHLTEHTISYMEYKSGQDDFGECQQLYNLSNLNGQGAKNLRAKRMRLKPEDVLMPSKRRVLVVKDIHPQGIQCHCKLV